MSEDMMAEDKAANRSLATRRLYLLVFFLVEPSVERSGSKAKLDGHRYPPTSFLPPSALAFPLRSISPISFISYPQGRARLVGKEGM